MPGRENEGRKRECAVKTPTENIKKKDIMKSQMGGETKADPAEAKVNNIALENEMKNEAKA